MLATAKKPQHGTTSAPKSAVAESFDRCRSQSPIYDSLKKHQESLVLPQFRRGQEDFYFTQLASAMALVQKNSRCTVRLAKT